MYLFIYKLFINNEWVNAESGKTFATYNPATGEKLADIQEGDKVNVTTFVLWKDHINIFNIHINPSQYLLQDKLLFFFLLYILAN